MIKNVLTSLVYLFYPRKICSRTQEDKYYNSDEHNRLIDIIKHFYSIENQNNNTELLEEFEKDCTLKNFRIVSLMDWQDRAITYNLFIIEDDELYTVSLYLSILVPYYVIKVQKNKIKLLFSNFEIAQMKNNNLESRKIRDLIIDIASIVESKTLYQKFPEELMNIIIEDVSFQEIGIGKFNMFNAFFNNIPTDEIKNNIVNV
jgi:hypothetical protein